MTSKFAALLSIGTAVLFGCTGAVPEVSSGTANLIGGVTTTAEPNGVDDATVEIIFPDGNTAVGTLVTPSFVLTNWSAIFSGSDALTIGFGAQHAGARFTRPVLDCLQQDPFDRGQPTSCVGGYPIDCGGPLGPCSEIDPNYTLVLLQIDPVILPWAPSRIAGDRSGVRDMFLGSAPPGRSSTADWVGQHLRLVSYTSLSCRTDASGGCPWIRPPLYATSRNSVALDVASATPRPPDLPSSGFAVPPHGYTTYMFGLAGFDDGAATDSRSSAFRGTLSEGDYGAPALLDVTTNFTVDPERRTRCGAAQLVGVAIGVDHRSNLATALGDDHNADWIRAAILANDGVYAGPWDTCADPSNDRDGDGLRDDLRFPNGFPHDNCPDAWNPAQTDTNHDGVGDECQTCPTAVGHDGDGDGVDDACDRCDGGDDRVDADGDGIPDHCDTCPDTAPSDPLDHEHRDCNGIAEEAVRATSPGVPLLGDECDPRGCPDTVPQQETLGGTGVTQVSVGNNHFRIDGRGLLARSPIPPHRPVFDSGRFGMRFCRCDDVNGDFEHLADIPGNCIDSVTGFGCALAQPELYTIPAGGLDDLTTRWRPIRTIAGRGDTIGSGERTAELTDVVTSAGPPVVTTPFVTFAPEYTIPLDGRAMGSVAAPPGPGVPPGTPRVFFPVAGADATVTWLVQQDIPRFFPPGQPRDRIHGILWSHVSRQTLIGGVDDCVDPQTLQRGLLCSPAVRALTSHYLGGTFQEVTAHTPPSAAGAIGIAVLPSLVCPQCLSAFPRGWLTTLSPCGPGVSIPQCDPNPVSVRYSGPGELDLSAALSPLARQALVRSGAVWLAPSEPPEQLTEATRLLVPIAADGSGVGSGIVLAQDGVLRLDDAKDFGGTQIGFCGTASATCLALFPALADPPEPRHDHGVAYWASRGLVYVVGGFDDARGAALRDVWEYRLVDREWRRLTLRGSVRPERVLASAVSYVEGALFVIDEITLVDADHEHERGRHHHDDGRHDDGCGSVRDETHVQRRLLRIDLTTGVAEPVATWRPREPADRVALAVVPDGSLYAIGSEARSARHSALHIEVRRAAHGTLHADVIAWSLGRPGSLASGSAVASEAGASVLIQRRDAVVEPQAVSAADLSRRGDVTMADAL